MKFLNITKMLKKPFLLRSLPGTHIKYAKKMKKFDREVLPAPKSRKSVFLVRDSLRTLFFSVGLTTEQTDIYIRIGKSWMF